MLAELRQAEKLLLTTHENPDGDALGSLLGDASHPRAARQGQPDVHVARRVPAAVGVPQLDLRRPDGRAAGRPGRAHDRVPRLRQHRPHARGLPPARRAPHPQHRPPPRQHALRHGQPGGAGGVLHGGDRLAALEGARGRAHPRDRRAALHRPRDRHRPLHVREHRRRGASHGRRPDQPGVEPRSVSRRLYEDLPFSRLELLQRALATRRAPRRRRAHRRSPRRRATTRRPAPSRPTPRA